MGNKNWIKILIVFLIGLLAGYLFAVQTGGSEDVEEISEVLLGEDEEILEDNTDSESEASASSFSPVTSRPATQAPETMEQEEVEEAEERSALTEIDSLSVALPDGSAAQIVATNADGLTMGVGSRVDLDNTGESYFIEITSSDIALVSPTIYVDGNVLTSYEHLPMGANSVANFEIEYQGDDVGYRFHKIKINIDGDGDVEEELSWNNRISMDSYMAYMEESLEDSSFTNNFKSTVLSRMSSVERYMTDDSIDAALHNVSVSPTTEEAKDIANQLFEAMRDLI